MEWDKFSSLVDQYEIASKELVTRSRRALAGDLGACDVTVLARAIAAQAEFVAVAEEVFGAADDVRTQQPPTRAEPFSVSKQ